MSKICLFSSLLLSFALGAVAQTTVATAPVGVYRISLLGDSDTFVSLPFVRPEAASGVVAGFSGSIVNMQGSPAWGANQFVYQASLQTNTHYLLVVSGAREGSYFPITGNGANSVTLDLNGDTLTGLINGDRISVVPYWTLATVFPGGDGIYSSTSQFLRKTEVLVPDPTSTGINLSAGKTYYFLGGNWRLYGPNTVSNDDVLLPDSYFIVRHNAGPSTLLTVRGSVVLCKWRIPLDALASNKQDNRVALPRPVSTTLNGSGLVSSGAFRSSPNRFNRLDELLTFDNSVVGKNKSASATYFYYSGHWERYGTPGIDVGDEEVLKPGTGVIVRKGGGTAVTWMNLPSY